MSSERDSKDEEPGVVVRISEMYEILIELRTLPQQFLNFKDALASEQAVQDRRLENHGTRIGDLEIRQTRLEERQEQADKARGSQEAKKPNWTAIGSLIVASIVLLTSYFKDLIQ